MAARRLWARHYPVRRLEVIGNVSEAKVLATLHPAGANALPPAVTHDSVNSDALLRGKSQLAIRHKNEIYILRQTRFGKLILTK